jgi:DNA-binding NarL/FixJ family response regulator
MPSGITPGARASTSVPKYLVVEDHKGFGQRLARVLCKWGKPTVVMTLRDAIAAIRSQRWTALFVDPGLPDGSGLEAIEEFGALQPFTPMLVLTGGATPIERARAWSLGARYIEKPDISEALIEDFLRSGSVLEAHLAEMAGARREEIHASNEEREVEKPTRRKGLDVLSYRERQVLTYKLRGEEDKAIAHDLGLIDSTVRVLLRRAAAKLGCASRDELLAKAAELGMTSKRRTPG